ncbi:non-specific lipid transfer protein GPI-anchored 9-like isoform X2 [Carex rostrata]
MEGKVVLLFSLLSLFLLPSTAQFFGLSGLPPCVPVLSPCLSYLHSDTPPPSCCIPLENAMEEQGDCLCSAFKDPNLLTKIKMTQDEMLKFPSKCGLSLPENSNCSALSSQHDKVSPAPSDAPTGSKAKLTPPPTEAAPSDESGAHGKSLQSLTILFSAVILPIIAVFHV